MAFLQFPATQYFRVFRELETTVKGGSFNLATAMEIKYIVPTIYINGTLGGNERIRAKIYPTDASPTAIYTSEWFNLSQVGTYTPNFIGNIWLEFATAKPINPNVDYFLRFEIDGYTANPDTFYIAMNLDWTERINETPAADQAGVRFRILGLKDVD